MQSPRTTAAARASLTSVTSLLDCTIPLSFPLPDWVRNSCQGAESAKLSILCKRLANLHEKSTHYAALD